MNPILCLETSGKHCSVAVFNGLEMLSYVSHPGPNDHARVILSAIQDALEKAGLVKEDLVAIALSAGPGSYTGLRIGAGAAKGLCHGLQIPLIAISSLEIMVRAIGNPETYDFLIPMIDARRNEVYCGVYQPDMTVTSSPGPLILDGASFEEFRNNRIVFLGDGAGKWQEQAVFPNADYRPEISADARFMGLDAAQKWEQKALESIAYFEPDYLKPVFLNS